MVGERLLAHRSTWARKRMLRFVYCGWYRRILSDLMVSRLPTLELGCGTGNFKEFARHVIASDVQFCPWSDLCLDAHNLPFEDLSIGNIVLVDVLHHLARPARFLGEAHRVLVPGGRILVLEPYPSPLSLAVYRAVHPEPFLMDAPVLGSTEVPRRGVWESNQAVSFLLFFRNRRLFLDQFGSRFSLVKTARCSTVLYPLSGGFDHPQMVPDWTVPFLELVEWVLAPLSPLMAFRCYVVLAKR